LGSLSKIPKIHTFTSPNETSGGNAPGVPSLAERDLIQHKSRKKVAGLSGERSAWNAGNSGAIVASMLITSVSFLYAA
jgi:hypothetical protein